MEKHILRHPTDNLSHFLVTWKEAYKRQDPRAEAMEYAIRGRLFINYEQTTKA